MDQKTSTTFNTNVIDHEFACRACGKQWKKTHAGGQLLKAGGALLSGSIVFFTIFGGGDDDNGGNT